MEDPFVLNIALEVVKAIIGVAIPALTIYLTFYTKRVQEKVERKALQNEIDRLTSHALQAKSFELMDYGSRVEAVVESIRTYAMRNDMMLHDVEIKLLVEQSFSSLKSLENVGLQLYKFKMERKNENLIDE
jgi:hypothetical protein